MYKRLLQLLITGEPDPLSRPKLRHYMGIDLGVREESVAVVGYRDAEGGININHVEFWAGLDNHVPHIGELLDSYDIQEAWIDAFQSEMVVRALPRVRQIKLTKRQVQNMHAHANRLIVTSRLRLLGSIPGKPREFWDGVVESLRTGSYAHSAPDRNTNHVDALNILLWGLVRAEDRIAKISAR